MNELSIIRNENGSIAIQCSILYKDLELLPNTYNRWIKRNIVNNKFAVENVDYVRLTHPTDGANYKKPKKEYDYILTSDFAKKLAMQVRNEKGEYVRNCFLEYEKRAKAKETDTITALKKELSAYRRLEQIRLIRIALNREVREVKKDVPNPNHVTTNFTNQLTLNFN